MPTIRLQQVGKVFKSKRQRSAAVLNIDLTIEQGEFIFLTGSRGAGKTTLLDIISGELAPDTGKAYFDEIDMYKIGWRQSSRVRGAIGRVYQEPQLIRTDTVFKNLASGKGLNYLRNRLLGEPRIHKALGLVGLAGTEDRYPLEFSLSDCRRIELAKAIVHSPAILVLDEFTDRMDGDTVWDMMQLLIEMNRRGTTVVMSTSAKETVNLMRKRVITLSDGKIVGDVKKGKYGHIV